MKKLLKKMSFFLYQQYTSIGGQAIIEGVMMRSPNAFVVAVRKADKTIQLRRDQWFGFSQKIPFFKKPFLRGILVLVESMANGIVSLNYSARIAMEEEKKKEALEKGESLDNLKSQDKSKEKVSFSTFLTMAASFLLGMGLFVFLPHALTVWIGKWAGGNWDLDSLSFHAVDGTIKAFIFVLYIFLIGFLPDIRRVFQYHGAEHKSIATFEAGEELDVVNARKFSTLHPRCGTTFIFLLLFNSIILFSVIFTLIPVGMGYPFLLKHLAAILFKILLIFPIAGLSYEIIRFAGKFRKNVFCRFFLFPGLMLQKLTTREPDDEQLEVALASIRAVLSLEEKYGLKEAKEKILSLEEVEIGGLHDISNPQSTVKDFLD